MRLSAVRGSAVRAIPASSRAAQTAQLRAGPDGTGKARGWEAGLGDQGPALERWSQRSWRAGGSGGWGAETRGHSGLGCAPVRGGCRGRRGEDATGPSPLPTPTRPLCRSQLTSQGTQGMALIRPGHQHWGSSSGVSKELDTHTLPKARCPWARTLPEPHYAASSTAAHSPPAAAPDQGARGASVCMEGGAVLTWGHSASSNWPRFRAWLRPASSTKQSLSVTVLIGDCIRPRL